MDKLAAEARKNLGHLPLASKIIDKALDNKRLIQVSDHFTVTETDVVDSSNDVVLSSNSKQSNVGDNADSNSDGKYKLISQISTLLTNTSKVISSRQIFSSEDDPKVNKVVDYIYKENKMHLTQIEDDKEAVSSTDSTVSFKVSVRISSTEASNQNTQSNNVFHEMDKIEYPGLKVNENNAVEAKNIFGNTQTNENSHSKTCTDKHCNCHCSALSSNSKLPLFSKSVTKQVLKDLPKEKIKCVPSEHSNVSGKKQEMKKEFIEKPSNFFPCKEPIKKFINKCSTEDISQNIAANVNIYAKEKENENFFYEKRDSESKLSKKFESEYIGNRKKRKYSKKSVIKIMPEKIFRKNVPKFTEKNSAAVKTSVTTKSKRRKNAKNNFSKCTGNSSLKKIKHSRKEDLNYVKKNANDYKHCMQLRKRALNFSQLNSEINSSTANIQSNCQKEGNSRILKRKFDPIEAGRIEDDIGHINKQKQFKIVEPKFDLKLQMKVSVVLEDIFKKNSEDGSFEKGLTSTKGIRTTTEKNVLEQLRAADPKLRIEPRVVLRDINEVRKVVVSFSFAEAQRKDGSCNMRNPNKMIYPKEKKMLFSKPRRMRTEEMFAPKSLPSNDPKLKMEPCVVLKDINNGKNISSISRFY